MRFFADKNKQVILDKGTILTNPERRPRISLKFGC